MGAAPSPGRVGGPERDAPRIPVVHSSSADVPPPAAGLEVRPFRALTYRRRDPEHLARVSSPAYDLVTPAGREHLAAADPHNIVRLILPGVDPFPGAGDPAGTASPAELALATLRLWEGDGVLVRDTRPALWLYEMIPPGDVSPTRGWLGAVGLPAAGSRAVLPHEDTYAPAVEGRRALLAATRTDLEPIVLAHDPEPTLPGLSAHVRRAEPDLHLVDADGVAHRLWRVGDPEVVAGVSGALRRTGAVIADGHHRFAAAQAHHREHPDSTGSDAILALVTPMGPAGLRVQPIHRVVPDLDLDTAIATAGAGFSVEDRTPGGAGSPGTSGIPAEVRSWLDGTDEPGFLLTDGRRLVRLSLPSPAVLATVPAEAPAAWRGLDVVLAQHGLLAHLWHRRDDPASVLVAHDVDEALRTAAARDGTALLLRAPSPTDVADVARAGARMPRKSTLFVPKPRTGLVLRPHDD
jgi:uncharacterized protein (DUF1015 family)